jgi:anaerobic selenocysteine-containing dehydrogenase
MGFTDHCFNDSEDDMIRQVLSSGHTFMDGVTLERLDREHWVRLNISPEGEPFVPFAEGAFGTPSGKCELGADALDYVPPVESRFGDQNLRQKYPLELITSKADNAMNSTFGYRDTLDAKTGSLHLCAEDAAGRRISAGDRVRAFNDRGSLTLRAEIDETIRSGVVRIPAVRWAKRAEDGRSANALTSERLTDMGGGPAFFSCLVEVERCAD